jgi:predicted MFS family arabinose efflux permease
MNDRWLVLALAFLARMALPLQFQSIPAVLPFLVADLGISYAQAGLLIGVFWLPGVFLSLPGGMLGPRFGDKRVIVGGLACMTAGAVLLAGSGSFALALAGRLLSGVGAVVLNAQLTKVVTDRFAGREIATALGILLTSWPLGIAVAMATLGFVAASASWQSAMVVTAAFTALSLVVLVLLYRDAPAAPGTTATVGTLTARELGLVTAAGVVWMLYNVSFTLVTSFTPLLLLARGSEAAQASALVSLVSWASLVAVPLGGYLTDRSGRPDQLIAAGALVSGVAIVLLLPPGPALPWILLFGVAGSLGPGAIMALPSAVLRPEARSVGLGVFYTTYYAGMVCLPPLAGSLHDATGTAGAAVLAGGIVRMLTAAALAGFRLGQRRWPAATATGPAA